MVKLSREKQGRYEVFWIGLGIGLFIGANIGLVVLALCQVAGRKPDRPVEEENYGEY